jgi:hypothetical protein
MSKRAAPAQDIKTRDPKLPIGQHEGEGTNAVQHEPDPSADPIADGEHKYIPSTGFPHGNQ